MQIPPYICYISSRIILWEAQSTNYPNLSEKSNSHVTHQILSKMHISRWRGGIREIAMVLVLYAAYSFTQGNLAKTQIIAFQNAFNLIDIEKRLHVFCELGIQQWFMQNSTLIHLANSVYSFLFYPAIIAFAIWAYNRHHPQYQIARNVFMVSAGIGLVCFALYPMAPPRMLSDLGFVDTLAQYEVVHYSASIPSVLVNQYAAMPSFHFGWTFLVGAGTFWIAKSFWLKLVGLLVPLLMFISIVATGNHFILDAVAGAAIIFLSYAAVSFFFGTSVRKVFSHLSRNRV
jgi:membrane-associated phospholipid phosphatase